MYLSDWVAELDEKLFGSRSWRADLAQQQNKNDRESKMKNKRKNKLTCQLGVVASDFLFSGGFYSDNLAFVAKGCKKCPNGSYVAYDKKPGKSVLDCKTCPLGKQALTITYLYIEEMPNGRIYSRHIPNQVIYSLLTQRVRLQKIFQ